MGHGLVAGGAEMGNWTFREEGPHQSLCRWELLGLGVRGQGLAHGAGARARWDVRATT